MIHLHRISAESALSGHDNADSTTTQHAETEHGKQQESAEKFRRGKQCDCRSSLTVIRSFTDAGYEVAKRSRTPKFDNADHSTKKQRQFYDQEIVSGLARLRSASGKTGELGFIPLPVSMPTAPPR